MPGRISVGCLVGSSAVPAEPVARAGCPISAACSVECSEAASKSNASSARRGDNRSITGRTSAEREQAVDDKVDGGSGRPRIFGPPTIGGVALGLLFWWTSLTPTLIPRPWLFQALVGGVCLAIGYGIGSLVGRLIQRLLDRSRRSPGPSTRRLGWVAVGVAWLIAILAGAALWLGWQNAQLALMGMPAVGWFDAIAAVALSVAAGAILVVLGRAVVVGLRGITGLFRRILPESRAMAAV